MTAELELLNNAKKHAIIENSLTVLVSLFAVSIYFSKSGLSVFGIAALLLMVYWRFVPGYVPKTMVPKSVIICFSLFFVNLLVSSYMSVNSNWALSELGKYRHLLFGALLFVAPLSRKNRTICLVAFLISASLEGLTGLLQYVDIQYWKKGIVFWTRAYLNTRPLGNSSDQILYAANLALAFGTALGILFVDRETFQTKKEKMLIALSAVVIIFGIIASGSRGVWIAVAPACLIALYYHSRKSALILLSVFLVVILIVATFSTTTTQRVTSLDAENAASSTGNRIELWKGALLMFKQSPIVGVGAGDFQSTIKEFIAEKKLRETVATNHAHSIYFQALATRGLIGISVLIAFFSSLVLWGRTEMKDGNKVGGLVILTSALLAILGGLTENHIEVHRYLAAFGFTIGLMGPFGINEPSTSLT